MVKFVASTMIGDQRTMDDGDGGDDSLTKKKLSLLSKFLKSLNKHRR